MSELSPDSGHVNYVQVDEALCNGCVLCMKVCPTKAIRVKAGKACLEGVCIDCVECVRVCPRGAIKAVTPEDFDLEESGNYVVSASTVLYSQFGEHVLPNDILLGLKRMGFRYVHDQSYTSEMFSFALGVHIKQRRKKADSPFPLISPICPVVVRLIAYRFPSLLKHILPLVTPREIVAREAKQRLRAKYGPQAEQIKVLHITPCPSKMISIREPVSQTHSYLDTTIGINRIYEAVNNSIQEIDEDMVLHHSSGAGLAWGMSGGEIAGLEMNCLAISGLQETILYLEKIEMGLLQDIDYLELRTCPEGCVGGPFTVADKYLAKNHLQKLIQIFGVKTRVKYNYIIKLYKEGWFHTDRKPSRSVRKPSQRQINERIGRLNRVDQILKRVPRKECGVCGSPDCRTFAEDVVDGRARMEDCLLLHEKTGK
ncbi:MAG: [Fe-Fe] hydrogenase large subunit C-terminal domain-containing protein [Desulfobacteraceae bacterium]|jgi:iron only hydrogenase large subunit-like protein